MNIARVVQAGVVMLLFVGLLIFEAISTLLKDEDRKIKKNYQDVLEKNLTGDNR